MADAHTGMPTLADLAALRAWYEGMGAREAVQRYLPDKRATSQSSRAILGRLRRRLATYAVERHRPDLAESFTVPAGQRTLRARAMAESLAELARLPAPQPVLGDSIERWLSARAVEALHARGIKTLADLTVRIPRRRRWWAAIPGLGQSGARRIEAFFATHPELTDRARALIQREAPQDVVPWERLRTPQELDGSRGAFRAPRGTSTLRADNDYEAVRAWIDLHESPATQRAYRKEAERLLLWSVVERARPLSSLTTEDAVAYRAFLRHPSPRSRWVGPIRPRCSPEWRPFSGDLSPRSVAHAITVLGALFRWLVEQRYLLANPFAGVKVRNARRTGPLDAGKSFTDGEWQLLVAVAQGLEWSYGWSKAASQRLRFLLNFCYATGLRAEEFVSATLGDIVSDADGRLWLQVEGKGGKRARVAVPPFALLALEGYLAGRGLPVQRARWAPRTPIVGGLATGDEARITSGRLWSVMRRFFMLAAEVVRKEAPATAVKFASATPHWMRHTHASHALQRGVELTAVRDNLRHSSIATTSVYLHAGDARRASQMAEAFAIKPQESGNHSER